MAVRVMSYLLLLCLLFAVSVASTLPPNWISFRAENGRQFYYNNVTHQSQWDLPSQPIRQEEVENIPVIPRGYHRRCHHSSTSTANSVVPRQEVAHDKATARKGEPSFDSADVQTIARVNGTVVLGIEVVEQSKEVEQVRGAAEVHRTNRTVSESITPPRPSDGNESTREFSLSAQPTSPKAFQSSLLRRSRADTTNATSTRSTANATEAGSSRTWVRTAQDSYAYAKSWWQWAEARRNAQEARKQNQRASTTAAPPPEPHNLNATHGQSSLPAIPEPVKASVHRHRSVFGITKLVAGKSKRLTKPAVIVATEVPAADASAVGASRTGGNYSANRLNHTRLAALETARATQVATISDLTAQISKLELELRAQKLTEENLRRAMESAVKHTARQAAERIEKERDIERARTSATVHSAVLLERLVSGLDLLHELRDEATLTAATEAAAASAGPGGGTRNSDVETVSGNQNSSDFGVETEVGGEVDAPVQDASQDLHVAAVLAQACVLLRHGAADNEAERAIGSHETCDVADTANLWWPDAQTPTLSSDERVLSGAADAAMATLREGYATAIEEIRKEQAQLLEEQREQLQKELDRMQRDLAQCAAENAVLRQELSVASTLLCSLRGQPLYPIEEDRAVSDVSNVRSAAAHRGFVNMICAYCRRLWSLWN